MPGINWAVGYGPGFDGVGSPAPCRVTSGMSDALTREGDFVPQDDFFIDESPVETLEA